MVERESKERVVRQFLSALADPNETMDGLGRFFHSNVIQVEYPNAVVPNGARRDLAALALAHERGAAVITGQRYDISKVLADGDQVAVELEWTGTLKVPYGSRPAGSVMRAHIAIFFELRDGRIVAQRNYDCYEPWTGKEQP